MKHYIFISSNSRTLYVRTNTSTSNSQNGAKTFSGLINSLVKECKEVPKFTRFRHIIISDHAIRLIYINTLQALKTFLKNETTDITKLRNLLVNIECVLPPNQEIFLSPDVVQHLINLLKYDLYSCINNGLNLEIILQRGSYNEIKYSLSLLFNKASRFSISSSVCSVLEKARNNSKSISAHRRK